MDTSLSTQPNKPAFGTSDFAVSTAEAREYIDATAEETCPAESVPMPEPDTGPQRMADDATEAPSAATLEVMDQLKALAHNVTQGNGSSFDDVNASPVQSEKSEDEDTSDRGQLQAAEPSISVLPRPTGFEGNQPINDGPKPGNKFLTLAGFALAAGKLNGHQPGSCPVCSSPSLNPDSKRLLTLFSARENGLRSMLLTSLSLLLAQAVQPRRTPEA